MTEAQKLGEDEKTKELIDTKVRGNVKWFNVKSGYGFINKMTPRRGQIWTPRREVLLLQIGRKELEKG